MKRIIYLFLLFSLTVNAQLNNGIAIGIGYGGANKSLVAPSITVQPVSVNVNQGSNTSFSVTATGTGLTYQWQYLNGLTWGNLSNAGVYSGVTTNTLTVTGATVGIDQSNYRCIVTGNKLPPDTSNVAVVSVIITPSNLLITSVAQTQLTLNWTNVGGASYTGQKIYISTDGINYTLNKTNTPSSTSTDITSLSSNTKYYFKISSYLDTIISPNSVAAIDSTIIVPTDIAGLTMWVKPDGSLYKDAGKTIPATLENDSVMTWDGEVGTVDAVAPALAQRPLLKTSGFFNSHKSLYFRGAVNTHMVTPSFLGTGYNKAFSMFFITNFEVSAYNVAFSSGGEKFWYGKNIIYRGFRKSEWKMSGLKATTNVNIMAPIPGSTEWAEQVGGITYDGVKRREYWGGNYREEAETDNTGLTGTLYLGDYSTPNFYKITGYIGEVLVYNAGLAVADATRVSRYLGWKYAKPLCKRRLLFDGDSITELQGQVAGMDISRRTRYYLGNKPEDHVYNIAVSGDYLRPTGTGSCWLKMQSLGASLYFPDAKNVLTIFAGTNDLWLNTTDGTTAYGYLSDYCTYAKSLGYKVVVVTMLPRSSNQYEAERQIYNGLIRTNAATLCDAVADAGNDATIGEENDQNNTTYYMADKTHLIDAGADIVAQYISAAINTLP